MQKLVDIYKLLDGKKTYILAAIIAVLNLLVAFGWLDHEVAETISLLLGGGALATLRSGVTKSKPVTE